MERDSLVPDLVLPLPDEEVHVDRKFFVKEIGLARWTGTEWAFNVSLDNGDQAWIIQNPNTQQGRWLEIPEPERLTAPTPGTSGPLS